MSNFDRFCPVTGKAKGAFDQILTSWFLEGYAKKILSKHFLLDCSWYLAKAKIQAGIWEHEDELYLPVFYQGKIPSPTCAKVFLSFRKINNEKWRYGYVLIKEANQE